MEKGAVPKQPNSDKRHKTRRNLSNMFTSSEDDKLVTNRTHATYTKSNSWCGIKFEKHSTTCEFDNGAFVGINDHEMSELDGAVGERETDFRPGNLDRSNRIANDNLNITHAQGGMPSIARNGPTNGLNTATAIPNQHSSRENQWTVMNDAATAQQSVQQSNPSIPDERRTTQAPDDTTLNRRVIDLRTVYIPLFWIIHITS